MLKFWVLVGSFFSFQFFNVFFKKKSFLWILFVLSYFIVVLYNTISINFVFFNLLTIFVSWDLFGSVLFFLTFFTAIFCFLLLDLKFFKNKMLIFFLFFLFLPILYGFFFSSNMLYFFLFYECLLLCSVLFTYVSSPNIRSKNVSFYFLLWTQAGSFLVFLGLIMLYFKTNNMLFFNINFLILSYKTNLLINLLLFFGFGLKIPIWPFHFWLTKTHVEANTGFSIFLSGILVKTALFGLYKFNLIFGGFNLCLFFIVFLGIIDAGLKIIIQVDLKKIVAYCTIFEMNIILINFFFFSYNSYLFFLYFSILHTLLSFYFFFLVDCIYKRYNTRSILAVSNIINFYPMLGLCLVCGVLLFNGLPLTLKFNLEVVILQKLLNFSIIYYVLFIIIQILIGIFLTKIFFSVLFIFRNNINKKTSDLTTRELLIFSFLIFIFFVFSIF